MNFAVGVIVKNEEPYLLEWIAFHKAVGFSHFLIADNGSSDATRQMLRALGQTEAVTVLDYPDVPGVRPQMGAYAALLKLCPPGIDAVAFIDIDEFILPLDGSRSVIPVLSERFGDNSVGAVAINWCCFGSGGHRFLEDGLVMERFTKRAPVSFGVNKHYKVVVRPSAVVSWDSPHHATLTTGRYVHANGETLAFRPGFSNSLSESVKWEGLRINHYVVKSLEEFLVRKSPKGSASKEGRIKHRKYFELHDRNDEDCTLIQPFVEDVKHEIANLESSLASLDQESAGTNESPLTWRQKVASFKANFRGA